MSLLELLMAANNKPLYKICIFSLGSNALVTALLPLTYFLLGQLSDFNRIFKLNWNSFTLFAYTCITIPQDGISLLSICLIALLNAS